MVSERRAALFISHGDTGALKLAASCVLTLGSVCERVDVVLLGPAVKAVMEAAREISAGESEPGDPAQELLRARADGIRLVACSASVVEEQIDFKFAEQAFDAVVGWPTIVEWTKGVVDRFFF